MAEAEPDRAEAGRARKQAEQVLAGASEEAATIVVDANEQAALLMSSAAGARDQEVEAARVEGDQLREQARARRGRAARGGRRSCATPRPARRPRCSRPPAPRPRRPSPAAQESAARLVEEARADRAAAPRLRHGRGRVTACQRLDRVRADARRGRPPRRGPAPYDGRRGRADAPGRRGDPRRRPRRERGAAAAGRRADRLGERDGARRCWPARPPRPSRSARAGHAEIADHVRRRTHVACRR